MNKILLVFCLVWIMAGVGLLITNPHHTSQGLTETEVSGEYQGPVPIGYNETHFRQTGETILNVEVDDGDN